MIINVSVFAFRSTPIVAAEKVADEAEVPKVVEEEAVLNGTGKVADETVDAVPAVVAENGASAEATPVEEVVDAAEEAVDAPVAEETEKVAEVETTNGVSTGKYL